MLTLSENLIGHKIKFEQFRNKICQLKTKDKKKSYITAFVQSKSAQYQIHQSQHWSSALHYANWNISQNERS